MRIIAVVNQKGGVGKTTTSINVASTLSAINYKVLLIDLDPQGNLSSGIGLDYNNRNTNMYNVLIGETDINKSIQKTKIPNLYALVATTDLAIAEIELANVDNREYVLKNKLHQLEEEYDFVFIDCPPSLGMLTINALCAVDEIIVPLQCEFFALEGLAHLLDTVNRIKDNHNSELNINGIVLTMYDKRNKLTEDVEKDVRNCFGELVYKTVIPRNVRLSEASSHGIPAILYDSNCSGSIAYMNLVKEILRK